MKAFLTQPIVCMLFSLILAISACRPTEPTPIDPMEKLDLTPYEVVLPDYFFPLRIPADNPLTVAKVDLGKKLFYDPVLSVDYSVSCNSCHQQEYAFSDPKRFSQGVGGSEGNRQSMPLFNLGFDTLFFWDGRATTLEEQALVPIEDPVEMSNTVEEVVKRLNADSVYIELFHKAFGRNPDADGIAKAIASFERTLISSNSKFDKFLQRRGSLTPLELLGRDVFAGPADCFHCHQNVTNFTNYRITNNGLYEEYADQGLADVTGKPEDIGKFKAPSLRNLKYTAPYMHDGSIETLEEVIDFYVSGRHDHPNMDIDLQHEIFLSLEEKQALRAFLLALSDDEFIVDERYR